MNLFENLQLMKESDTSIVSEFKEFLSNKNAQYIANEIGETKDGMQIVIYDGDWKHEHLYMKHLLDEFFTNKGIDISIISEEIGESDQDTFSARYDIVFNAKPKTYTTDVKSLKFTTEDIEDSYNNDGLITELRTDIGPHNELRYEIYQDGTLIFHSTNKELAKEKFKEISTRVSKEYKMVDGKYKKFNPEGNAGLVDIWNSENESINEVIENINKSSWKQRYKDVDSYKSDEYPEYIIRKTITSTKQEVWQVLDSKTNREVFCSGTFEDAIEFVEKKSNLKEDKESNSFQIGEEYEWSGLYGGSYTGTVKEIDEESITLDVSWTAEDTGKLVQKEMTYDLETDDEGNIAFIVWRYSGEKGYVYPKSMSITESVENNINLDDYEYVCYGSGYNRLWQLYRRFDKELNKGVWVAKHQNTGEIKSITYDQAQGFEPIEDSGINRLSRDLGRMLLPKRESISDDWEYVEKTTTKDEIFGDIVESDYYVKKYSDDMTGYIYPPSELEKLYRAKLIRKNHIKSLGYNAFIELDSAKEFLDNCAYNLTPVTYEEIKQQLEEIDTNEYLEIDIDNSPNLNTTKVTITGTLINENEITFYDSSYLRTQRDIDFIKEQYAKASKEITHMRKRGYLGVKGESLIEIIESNEEDYDDNAATFLDKLEAEVKEAAHKFMLSVGFPEDEADDYLSVSTDINDDYVMIAIGAELGYDSLSNLCNELNKVIAKYDDDAYFEPECPGRINAYLFGEKLKQESLNKIEETNHNIIEDRDYATGEEIYRELVIYLNSLDQIAMNGDDCNWEPSEFNAKNLNADGEIYLECGAYILIYPYINEWAEDYFRVIVIDAETCELSIQLRNGIERIFNKFKTDKWKLIFEG